MTYFSDLAAIAASMLGVPSHNRRIPLRFLTFIPLWINRASFPVDEFS
jgi:hypothetical protein